MGAVAAVMAGAGIMTYRWNMSALRRLLNAIGPVGTAAAVAPGLARMEWIGDGGRLPAVRTLRYEIWSLGIPGIAGDGMLQYNLANGQSRLWRGGRKWGPWK